MFFLCYNPSKAVTLIAKFIFWSLLMEKRVEHDFIGELEISNDVYYGVQTFRALQNFNITGDKLSSYPSFIKAFAQVKKAAALANNELQLLDDKKKDAICKACDRIIDGELRNQFVVDMIQGGAGTSTNMNTNEVVANLALEIMGYKKGEYQYCHPNDHVNLSQSTNDSYPTAIHVALYDELSALAKDMEVLRKSFEKRLKNLKMYLKWGVHSFKMLCL